MAYPRTQISEIESDSTLRFYGAALALTNTVTALFWLSDQPLARILGRETPAVCWPFFESCYSWRVLTAETVTGLVAGLLVLSLVNAALFLERRQVRFGWWLLALMTAAKCVVLMQDFRLLLNQHYMALWITLAFLLIPSKRWLLPRLIVAFYVAAGLLKLNHEWLSGSGLYGLRPFGMSEQWIPIACGYVVVLELLIVFGLLSHRRWIKWASLSQILLFHIGSFWVVGFFYPILMFLILSIIPMSPLLNDDALNGRLSVNRTGVVAYSVIIIFFLLQTVPRILSSEPAITGEGRIFALNMFDAPVQCRATATSHQGPSQPTIRLGVPLMQPRLACDPIMYLEIAKARCRERAKSTDIGDFDLRLESRKAGVSAYRTVVDLTSFCSADIHYSFWHHNAWILLR